MPTPSFMRLFRDLKGAQAQHHPVWEVNAKMDGREFAASHGVRVPTLLATAHEATELPEPSHHAVVVKPNEGCVSTGVLPVVGTSGAWRSHFGGRVRPWGEWMARLQRVPRRPTPPHTESVATPWLVEAMVGDGTVLPDALKAHCIHGRVAFWSQARVPAWAPKRTDAKRVAYWTRDWSRVDGGVLRSRFLDPNLPAPSFQEELTATAELLASHLPTPYVRIDLYEDEGGPVFGEITPHPGRSGSGFLPEWDERLGRTWLEGAA